MNRKMRQSRTILAAAIATLASSAIAWAAPTQEEVFRSINENVGSTVDIDRYMPYILVIVASIILAAVFNHRRQNPGVVKRVNHVGKLVREVARSVHLKSPEVKQLKLMAEEQKVANPLMLLLCPSVLARAMRTRNPKIDRTIMEQIVRRLRGNE
jgi:uncharacterized membrane protein (DUF106 family)